MHDRNNSSGIAEEKSIFKVLEKVLLNECPFSVLEISGFDGRYGKLISDFQTRDLPSLCNNSPVSTKVDRVDLSGGNNFFEYNIYDNVYNTDYLIAVEDMSDYDIILIFHLFENMVGADARFLLESLLKKTKKQVLVSTPIYPYDLDSDGTLSDIRTYHPFFFLGMDFSYILMNMSDDTLQFYSFFPSSNYGTMRCDLSIKTKTEIKNLKVAYILTSKFLTGGIKALLQQIKELTARGHKVSVYYRGGTDESAIPSWSHLTENDFAYQKVIPEGEKYTDYIKDVDIIVLSWADMIPEFVGSKIPIALWEQGSELLYGVHRELQFSKSKERLIKHHLYRQPVHLLAVSETIKTILKGVYNRESQLFPNGIDTDFYFPLPRKSNEKQTILLVGNPFLKFKGFDFALTVLEGARRLGLSFNVWWASQVDFAIKSEMLEIVKFIEPSQKKMAELYRNADVLLSTSLYESFALPPLEAMASGTAVISTDNGGINMYAKPDINCFLCAQGDYNSVLTALVYLLQNPGVRESLTTEGRKTALEYSFNKVVPILEQCLIRIVDAKIDESSQY